MNNMALEGLTLKINQLQFGSRLQFDFIETYCSLKSNGSQKISDRITLQTMLDLMTEEYGFGSIQAVVCRSLLTGLKEGDTLSHAMRGWFNEDIIQVFDATYQGSNLKDTMRTLLSRMTDHNKLKGNFFTGLIMPIMIIVYGLGVTLMVSIMFIPTIKESVKIEEMGMIVKFYAFIGDMLTNYGLTIIAFIAFLLGSFFYSLNHWNGSSRMAADKTPFYGVYSAFAANKLFGVLTLLVESGVSLRQALEIIARTSTPYMAWHIDQMLEMTRQGEFGLLQLETGLLPSRLRLRMRVAGAQSNSQTGSVFSSIAEGASDDFIAHVKMVQRTLSAIFLIIGLLMILAGIFTLIVVSMDMAMNSSY